MSRREVKSKSSRFFTTEEELDKLYELAFLNLPIKSIAANIGCSYQQISTNEMAASIVAQGHSDYLKKLNREMHRIAFLDLNDPISVFPEDRAMWSSMKTKMLAELHKVANKDPFVAPQEVERVRRLSDDELAIEIQKIAETQRKTVASGRGL